MGLLSLVAQLGLDATGFQLGLKKSEGSVKSFSKSVNAEIKGSLAAAFGAAAIGAASKSVIDYAGSVNDMAARLSVSAEMAQALSYAIKQSGGSMEDLEKAMLRVAVNQQAALGGNAEMIASFERLGVSQDDLKSKRFDEVFLKISKAQETAADSGRQLTDMIAVMGKGAAKVLPAMRDGLAGAVEEAKNLGVVMSNDVISALDDMGDSMETAKSQIVSGFGPALVWVADKALMIADAFRISAKAMGNFFGTLAGGGSVGQALDSTGGAAKEVMNERVARETAQFIKGNRRRERGTIDEQSSSASETIAGPGRRQSVNVDSLARVGGFGVGLDVGVRSLSQEARRHTALLKEIKTNTAGGVL